MPTEAERTKVYSEAYPNAEELLRLPYSEDNIDFATRLHVAGRKQEPITIPERGGVWLITEIFVEGDKLVVRGVGAKEPPDHPLR